MIGLAALCEQGADTAQEDEDCYDFLYVVCCILMLKSVLYIEFADRNILILT